MICLRRRNLLRSLDHLAKPGLAPSATDQTVPGGWDRLEPVLLRDTPWKNREIYAKTKDLRSSGGLEHVLFLHILGMSSSELTNSNLFQRGR